MASHLKVRTEKTGHYYQHGRLSQSTRFVWICLHGYGQLAKHFISRFEFLDPELHLVIAAEGLNRFYFEGLNDRPVATWMTREDRLDEIADYILFLESLRKKLGWDKNERIRVIYLGFSQGVTTLLRWLVDAAPRADYILLWAGGIPDDILFDRRRAYFEKISAFYFVGDVDVYLPEERVQAILSALMYRGLNCRLVAYRGEHKIDQEVMVNWVNQHLNNLPINPTDEK